MGENKRSIEKEAQQEAKEIDERIDGGRIQRSKSEFQEISENEYNVLLQQDDNSHLYEIRKKNDSQKLPPKDLLFQLQLQEIDHDKYCWAVWKNKRFKNTF